MGLEQQILVLCRWGRVCHEEKKPAQRIKKMRGTSLLVASAGALRSPWQYIKSRLYCIKRIKKIYRLGQKCIQYSHLAALHGKKHGKGALTIFGDQVPEIYNAVDSPLNIHPGASV